MLYNLRMKLTAALVRAARITAVGSGKVALNTALGSLGTLPNEVLKGYTGGAMITGWAINAEGQKFAESLVAHLRAEACIFRMDVGSQFNNELCRDHMLMSDADKELLKGLDGQNAP